jgi:regulatory protein YycI of two-component signal transduction system YycFG
MFNNLVRQKYPDYIQSEPSSKDYELADQLFLLFNQLLNSTELLVDHIVILDFDEYDDCSANYEEEDKNDIISSIDGMKYSYATMCAIVEYSKTHTFTSIRRRYRQIKYKEQLRRIKQYVKAEGTKTQKLQLVNDFVYAEFTRARECYLPIHDSDLRRLAIKKAHDLNIIGFTASHHWVLNFKRHHRISSRKVTKLVTKNHLEDRDKILKSAESFVQTVTNIIPHFTEDHILNSDQSSFKYVV